MVLKVAEAYKPPQKVLIVDTETTGADPDKSTIVEIGAILYSIPHRTALMSVATLLPSKSNDAAHINGIPADSLTGLPEDTVWEVTDALNSMGDEADVIVGHNCDFDQHYLSRLTFDPPWNEKRWVDTKFDFTFPKANGKSLVDLALAHGIGIGSAHRALTDCGIIAELFSRMHMFGLDLTEMFIKAMEPKMYIKGMGKFDQNPLMREAGFTWDPAKKFWWNNLTDEAAGKLNFPHKLLSTTARKRFPN